MFYDATSRMRSAGAETELPEVVEEFEDENWLKVEWYVVWA